MPLVKGAWNEVAWYRRGPYLIAQHCLQRSAENYKLGVSFPKSCNLCWNQQMVRFLTSFPRQALSSHAHHMSPCFKQCSANSGCWQVLCIPRKQWKSDQSGEAAMESSLKHVVRHFKRVMNQVSQKYNYICFCTLVTFKLKTCKQWRRLYWTKSRDDFLG